MMPRLDMGFEVRKAIASMRPPAPARPELWLQQDALLAAVLAAKIHGTDKAVRESAYRSLQLVHPVHYDFMLMILNSSRPLKLIELYLDEN